MTLKIEQLPIDKLQFDSANARKHSDANIAAIVESLRQFGQRKPVVVTGENVIVAGNGTVEAARLLGLTDVDVVRVPKDWSADQVKAFALADNRTAELAEWNVTVLDNQLQELQFSGIDVEALGFAAVEMPPDSDWSDLNDAVKDRDGMQQMTFNLSDNQVESIQDALRLAKSLGPFDELENMNSNGNALARVCELFVGSHGS